MQMRKEHERDPRPVDPSRTGAREYARTEIDQEILALDADENPGRRAPRRRDGCATSEHRHLHRIASFLRLPYGPTIVFQPSTMFFTAAEKDARLDGKWRFA